MKHIFIGSLAFLSVSSIAAQDCTTLFPAKEGNSIEMTHYDGKDKMTGRSVTVINATREEGGTYFWKEHVQSFSDKGKMDFETDAEMSCSNGEIRIDMKNMIPQQQMQGMENMEMSIEGGDMMFPSSLSVGQTLPDAHMTMKASSGGMVLMNMVVDVTNRKIEGKESVTTPAGTFECYKMSSDISTKMMFSIKAHSVSWLSPGAGMVKQESYDDKGRLTSREILTKLVH